LTSEDRPRERIAYLRQLALDSLNNYSGGFAGLERVDRDLKWTFRSLEEVADPAWTGSLFRQWAQLEIIYASALAEGRIHLTEDEEAFLQEVVARLRAELEGHDLPTAIGSNGP
jgi:hypothetical protein